MRTRDRTLLNVAESVLWICYGYTVETWCICKNKYKELTHEK
jgi:hypothetical protein